MMAIVVAIAFAGQLCSMSRSGLSEAPRPAANSPARNMGRRMSLHLLVIEGDTRDDREAYRAGLGMTASEAYAQTLMQLAPDAICQIGFPADEGASLGRGWKPMTAPSSRARR